MIRSQKCSVQALTLFLLGLMLPCAASATSVGRYTEYLPAGDLALGIEPEVVLTTSSGAGAEIRYAQGITDLNNFHVVLGTGSGSRAFRVGGALTFDFFPDMDGQPGIGIATQGLYVRKDTRGRFELNAVPYIGKTFESKGGDVKPYFGMPVGFAFADSRYDTNLQAAIGTIFKASSHLHYGVELGIDVSKSYSYISAAVTYIP
jgi:hypothetical protein